MNILKNLIQFNVNIHEHPLLLSHANYIPFANTFIICYLLSFLTVLGFQKKKKNQKNKIKK